MEKEREKGVLVYPVYSRRSGGLSVGINLFPDTKRCPFDCPYCEVFPFSTNVGTDKNNGFLSVPTFSPGQMEEDLRAAVCSALERNIPVRDICFSGNGEPSLSADFPGALERAGRVREEMVPAARLVLITNGAGLLDERVFSLLREAAVSLPGGAVAGPGALDDWRVLDTCSVLDIWLKVDAGTPYWYQKMNAAAIPFEELTAKLREFAFRAPVTIQTMLCAVDGEGPPPEEAEAWERLIMELAGGGGIRRVQIYGKARPAPEDPKAEALPLEYLERRAASLRAAFAGTAAGAKIPVEVFE